MKLNIFVKALVAAGALGGSALSWANEPPASPSWLHDKVADIQSKDAGAKIVVWQRVRDDKTQYFISVTGGVDQQSFLTDADGNNLCTIGGFAPAKCDYDVKPRKGDKNIWHTTGKYKPGGVDHVPVKKASAASGT